LRERGSRNETECYTIVIAWHFVGVISKICDAPFSKFRVRKMMPIARKNHEIQQMITARATPHSYRVGVAIQSGGFGGALTSIEICAFAALHFMAPLFETFESTAWTVGSIGATSSSIGAGMPPSLAVLILVVVIAGRTSHLLRKMSRLAFAYTVLIISDMWTFKIL
jgi:hypothetical protein